MVLVQTSIAAFEHVQPYLATAQQEVYDAIKVLGVATDKDVAAHLGWTINRVTPRRGELVKKGFVVLAGLTGDRVQQLWMVNSVRWNT